MTFVYRAPTLTVDTVIFRLVDGRLNVLLIKRGSEPFKGSWALPGGYNTADDTTMQVVDRVLRTKVGVTPDDLAYVEQLYTFDTVTRDPRGHAVSVTYLGLSNKLEPQVSEETQQPTYFPVDRLPHLAYDHADIIKYALERLRSKLAYTTIVFALMPGAFTLTQLQQAYEIILGRELDKRNFRKKFLSFDQLVSTGEYFQDGAHRPALLYRFRQPEIQTLLRDF
jgi:8-oxo-dGTP diphosphatase